jgi:hypothetical protein
MKKIVLKPLTFLAVCVFFAGLLVSGCKKDDTPGTSNIDVATGTFVGTLKVFDRPTSPSSQEYYNAVVTITKVGDNQLKVTAKTGEAYSDATPKTFTDVRYQSGGAVQSNSVAGSLAYLERNKEIIVVTEKQAATERSFTFTGTKQ